MENSTIHPVIAILQARMGSTRLPGKVLKEVMGRPLLSYHIERIRYCKYIDKLVIATTTQEEDDAIARFAETEGVALYRGSANDVLDRYYQAATFFKAEHIMRITGDCPLLMPNICDDVIAKYFETGADHVGTGQRFAEGLDCEVFSYKVLSEAWQNAKRPSEREHVCLYFSNNPENYKLVALKNPSDDSRYRITVDEKKDFEVVKAILEALYAEEHPCFSIEEIKQFLDTHPQIFSLNSHIIRNEGLIKSLQEEENLLPGKTS